MTDQGPFAPPSGALPPRAPAPAAPPTPPLPPPTGAPRPGGMPAPPEAPVLPPPPAPPAAGFGFAPIPPPPRRRRWVVPVVAGGSVLLLGLGALGVYGAVQLGTSLRDLPIAAPPVPGNPPAAPLSGDPGSPVAAEPLDCVGCFTFYDATTLRLLPQEYQRLGLPATDSDTVSTDAGAEHEFLVDQWDDNGGDPEECYFAYAQAPIAPTPAALGRSEADDRVHYPPWHSDDDGYVWLTEGIRLFDDSAAASAHLASIEDGVAGCEAYSLPATGWAATVTPAAALDLPPSVAAYGWIETGGLNRYYAFDLQRGNLVMRITLNTQGDVPDEASFRAFVESYAEELAALEPTG